MSDLYDALRDAEPAPGPYPTPVRRHARGRVVAVVAIVTLVVVIAAGWLLIDHFRKVSQQTAYNRVNKATQSLATLLGLDPAQHPTYAYVTHCDNGVGGYSGWSVSGTSSMPVTADQVAPLVDRLEAALRSHGYSDVKRYSDSTIVSVRGHGGGVGVFLTYQPKVSHDRVDFGAATGCDVAVDSHGSDGYPLTDDQGHLLPSPGTGTSTGVGN